MVAAAEPRCRVGGGQATKVARSAGGALVLAAVLFLVGASPAGAQNAPRGRFALFGNWAQRTDASGQSSDYSDLIGRFNLESDHTSDSLFEYAFDVRLAVYPSTERDSVLSLYDAYVGLRTANGRLRVRAGQQWIRELGGLGSIGGLFAEYRLPGNSTLGSWRFGLFGGLEPQYYDAGYVDDVTKAGTFVALDGKHGRRHVLGWVMIRNSDLIERSVAVFNNFFSVASKLYVYQALEYDLQGPADLGGGGLTYLLVNIRYRPVDFLEIQGNYHDGRSIDARTITEDAIAGRPVTPEALEGLLFESGQLRLTWTPARGIRLWAAIGSDRYSRDDETRDRLQFGAHFADLFGTGVDLSGTSTQFKTRDETYDALYLSLGRSFNREVYVSFDYSKALAYYRYDSADGGEVVARPNSDRFSLSANINFSREWTLLLTTEYVDHETFEEARGLAGIIFRF